MGAPILLPVPHKVRSVELTSLVAAGECGGRNLPHQTLSKLFPTLDIRPSAKERPSISIHTPGRCEIPETIEEEYRIRDTHHNCPPCRPQWTRYASPTASLARVQRGSRPQRNEHHHKTITHMLTVTFLRARSKKSRPKYVTEGGRPLTAPSTPWLGANSHSFPTALTLRVQMARTQKNKATSFHLGQLKAKLAKLKRELLTPSGGGGGGGAGFDVARTGVASIGFIGFPSVGKSTLMSRLTGQHSEAAAYEFTTLTSVPGQVIYNGW